MHIPRRAWFSQSSNWLFVGSRPLTWEGWLTHFVLVCLVVLVGFHFPGALRYPLLGAIVAAFYLLCGLKMEGGAPWLRSRPSAGVRHGAHRLLIR